MLRLISGHRDKTQLITPRFTVGLRTDQTVIATSPDIARGRYLATGRQHDVGLIVDMSVSAHRGYRDDAAYRAVSKRSELQGVLPQGRHLQSG